MTAQQMASPSAVGRRKLSAGHAAIVQVLACVVVSLGVGLFTGSGDGALHLLTVQAVMFFGLGMAVMGVRRNRRGLGPVGALVVVALTTWTIGNLGWDANILILHKEPFPSWTDAFYLLTYPALMAAVLSTVRKREVRRDVAALIDALMITVGVSVVAYAFLILDVAVDDSVSVLGRVIGVAYPLSDVLVFGVVARILVGSAARTRAGLLLVAALCALLVADTGFVVSVFAGVAASYDGWIDAAFTLFFLFAGLSLRQADVINLADHSRRENERLGPGRKVALAIAVTLPPLTLMAGGVAGQAIKVRGAAIGALVLFLLGLIRMSLLNRAVENKRELLEVLARTDALTGLPNRRTFDYEIGRAVDASRSDLLSGPLSIAMIDLDHFKAYNDSRGHAAGDELLEAMATSWLGELHRSAPAATLARYGGEEFAVIMPGVDEETAAGVLRRLLPMTPEGQTFSAGVADVLPDESPREVLARADGRLYEAKAHGRAMVVAGSAHSPSAPARAPDGVSVIARTWAVEPDEPAL